MIEYIKQYLYEEYVEKGKSVEIIRLENENIISATKLYDLLTELNIPIRKMKISGEIIEEDLIKEYVENNKSIRQCAKIFNVSYEAIRKRLIKFNIPMKNFNHGKDVAITKEALVELYINKDLTIPEVAKKLNLSKSYIRRKIKAFEIKKAKNAKKDLSIDLTNQVFGRLKIIKLINEKEHRWQADCLCGSKIEVTAYHLFKNTNAQKSCGCMATKGVAWDILPPYFISQCIAGAEGRNLEFSVTHKFLEDLFLKQNKRCALSGIELIFSRSVTRNLTTASLDRIDSKLGYTEDNVQWVHKKLNVLKMDTPNEDFINWCKLVAEFNKGNQ